MKILFPESQIVDSLDYFEPFFEISNGNVFASETIDFLNCLSTHILKDRKYSTQPGLIAFAFWIRKSNIMKFVEQDFNYSLTSIVSRGIVFHITPANVDYMFLYSWVLSILAGNKNILRLSNHQNEDAVTIIELIKKIAQESKYYTLLQSNIIVSYAHDDNINQYFSLKADARIIWGGDETIIRFKRYDTKPTVKDIYFSDKRSYSIIDSKEYFHASDKLKLELAYHFFNDSYIYNQKACSSPQIVFFIGEDHKNHSSSMLFWYNLGLVLKEKNIKKDTAVNIEHYLSWYLLASNQVIDKYQIADNIPTVVNVPVENIAVNYRTCGGGFFLETFITSIDDLIQFKCDADQTLTYYGLSQDVLLKYISNKGSKSNLRIVPIGQALNFDVIWDGYNLLYELVKVIRIK